MMGSIRNVNWDDFTDSVPAAVTALMMPLTFSISNGIALGFITYTVLKAGTGKFSDISIAMYALSILFVFKLIILG